MELVEEGGGGIKIRTQHVSVFSAPGAVTSTDSRYKDKYVDSSVEDLFRLKSFVFCKCYYSLTHRILSR